jgi:hypothetical protein
MPTAPLYVYLAWNVVHAPDEAPQWAVDANPEEKNSQRQLFAGMMSALGEKAFLVDTLQDCLFAPEITVAIQGQMSYRGRGIAWARRGSQAHRGRAPGCVDVGHDDICLLYRVHLPLCCHTASI